MKYYIDIDIKLENEFPIVNDSKFPILSMIFVEVDTKFGLCMIYGNKDTKIEQEVKDQIKDKLNKEINIKFNYFNSEEEILSEIVNKINLSSQLLGWNIKGYDLPYLYNRIKKVLGIEVNFPDIFDCMLDNNLRKYSSYNINSIAEKLKINLPKNSKEIIRSVLSVYTCIEIDKELKCK